jgi:hypothetical protein
MDNEIKLSLDKLIQLHEEVKAMYKEDRDRCIDNYETLDKQHKEILEELPFSDEGILEKAKNEALKQITECQKTLVPVLNNMAKILDTLIRAETIRSSAGSIYGNNRNGQNSAIDLNKMQELLEEKD